MKTLILGLLAVTMLASCSNHGEKVKIEGTKGEVFYKGDGVTEADAKKLGSYLKEQEYFDNAADKSVQLMKGKDGAYEVHFVVDEKKVTAAIEEQFVAFGVLISKNVFNNEPVNIFLSDSKLKDFKTLLFDKKKAEELLGANEPKDEPTPTDATGGYDHDTAGGVEFYWKGISDEESKRIADYIVQNGAFAGGTAQIYMTKENGRFVLRFPMIESARTDAAYLAEVDKVSKQIKDNVFADVPYSFHVTDEKMVTVKSWDY